MSQTADPASMFGPGPFENPATPGYHLANLGGSIGPLGPIVSLCAQCGVLLLNTDEVRAAHTRFHEQIQAIAKWIHEKDPKA